MPAFTCSDDIYRFLVQLRGIDGDGDTDLIALFTLALLEEERIVWAARRMGEGQAAPTEAEILAFYENRTERYVTGKLRYAEQLFSGFARAYLKDEVEIAKDNAVREAVGGLRATIAATQNAVIDHVTLKTAGKGWGVNITSGLIANFVFAFIAAVLFFVAANRLSLGDIISDIAKGRVEQGH